MKKIDEIAILKNMDILNQFTDLEFERLFNILQRVEFNKDEVIMKDGDIGDTMYFFVSGEAEVTKTLSLKVNEKNFGQVEKSMVKLKAELSPFFGDMALFENDTRSATIIAETNCILYEMHKNDFETLSIQEPAICVKLLRTIAGVLCTRIRKTNKDVIKLSTALSIALSKQGAKV